MLTGIRMLIVPKLKDGFLRRYVHMNPDKLFDSFVERVRGKIAVQNVNIRIRVYKLVHIASYQRFWG